MFGDNSKEFKGGLMAYSSTVEVVGNLFEGFRCKECIGLVLSLSKSVLKIVDNRFVNNDAY